MDVDDDAEDGDGDEGPASKRRRGGCPGPMTAPGVEVPAQASSSGPAAAAASASPEAPPAAAAPAEDLPDAEAP
eukprot:533740-Pyramimonas_sp.AAC.1